MAAHRSVISARKAREPALGRARVWCRRPGGPGTGMTVSDGRGRGAELLGGVDRVAGGAGLVAGAVGRCGRAGTAAWLDGPAQPRVSRPAAAVSAARTAPGRPDLAAMPVTMPRGASGRG